MPNHDTATPTLRGIDPRGLPVRHVAYCRETAAQASEPRITRQVFDAAWRQVAAWDPRLWGHAQRPNLTTRYSLSAQVLLTDSVDGGWQLHLLSVAQAPLSSWDARGTGHHTQFDPQLRPIAMTEQLAGQAPRVVERWGYGAVNAGHNQCARLVRHDHRAGTRQLVEYNLAGQPLLDHNRFLDSLALPDWPVSVAARDALLEAGTFANQQAYTACGELREQTDAMGNLRRFTHGRGGQVSAAWLTLAGAGQTPTRLVSAIDYNATGQPERETAGNGVQLSAEYAAEDGRLHRLRATATGGKTVQDLRYGYDPVGNILSIEDASQPTRFARNRRIEPLNRYHYDSLYQVVQATGREVAQPSHGPQLPPWQSPAVDPNQLRPYTQTFTYDAAGNLRTRQHSASATFQMFTAADSNRSSAREEDLAGGFDANGNQLELQRGQLMSWDGQNQLSRVTQVQREDGLDDSEQYLYQQPGQRLRKVRLSQTRSRTLRSEVRYLPGLEVHRDSASGEERHVLRVEAGRSQVCVLHWAQALPGGTRNDQVRYTLGDHLGSCTLELDEQGALLSQEGYYPFGGTAWWAGPSAIEANYKSFRYSGKERDATGLYYYGYRYYAPWLQRWVSADPGGDIGGINWFCFVSNNPVCFRDFHGLVKYKGKYDGSEIQLKMSGGSFVARGYSEIKKHDEVAARNLDEGLEYAKVAADAALNVLSMEKIPRKYREVISRVYGKLAEPKVFMERLRSEVQIMVDALDFRAQEQGKEQLVWVKMKDGTNAFTYRKDPHERIFMTEAALKTSPKYTGMVLVHELSHIKLGKSDSIYYPSGHTLNPADPSQQALEADRVSMGHKDNVLSQYIEKNFSKEDRVKLFGASRAEDIEKALKDTPGLRTNTLFNNADSFSLLVFSLGHEAVWKKQLAGA